MANWFDDRGFSTPIVPVEKGWRDDYKRPDTTMEGRVKYLKDSIAPMLRAMQPRYTKHELRALLGLLYHLNEAKDWTTR